jgi:hypothetical protein
MNVCVCVWGGGGRHSSCSEVAGGSRRILRRVHIELELFEFAKATGR